MSDDDPDTKDWENQDFMEYFQSIVEDHTGTFIFCFLINMRSTAGHLGKGAHVRLILIAKEHGQILVETPKKRALTVDFQMGGVFLNLFKFSLGAYHYTKPAGDYSELWSHTVSKNNMKSALANVEKHLAMQRDRTMHTYNQFAVFPGQKHGQNCSTYAAKIARKAGFVFFVERIWGANPAYLSVVLSTRKWATTWRRQYKVKVSSTST